MDTEREQVKEHQRHRKHLKRTARSNLTTCSQDFFLQQRYIFINSLLLKRLSIFIPFHVMVAHFSFGFCKKKLRTLKISIKKFTAA